MNKPHPIEATPASSTLAIALASLMFVITIAIALVSLMVVITMAGCGGPDPSEAAAATPAKVDSSKTSSAIRLDPSQLKQIRVEELSANAPADVINATGTVEFNADRMAKLLPPVSGQVQNLAVNVGDAVHKDDVLFVLSSREVAAVIADHQASHKDFELAEKTYVMTKDLFEHQAASRIALDQSENELEKARSRVTQSEEVLHVLGLETDGEEELMPVQPRIPVRAPIGGTVIERNVTNGQFVGSETTPLVTIADLSSVWVQADIFERDLRRVAVGQKAELTTAAYPNDRFSAQISRIASVVDPQTRTAKVRFLVANQSNRLKGGMFASISLHTTENASALTVPAKAVFVESGRTFAYIQTGPRDFSRREVETAAGGSERVRVLHGMAPGDRIVSDGVLLLRQLEADTDQ